MQALTNLELTERLLALEQSFLESQNRNIENTYRSENNGHQIDTLDHNLGELRNEVFPLWSGDGVDYLAAEKVSYNGLLWKCLQNHTSQVDWAPDIAPSLWVRVDDPGEEWPEWRQPTGATDAYELGAKVSHNNKHWISNVGDNVWEPGVYGWDEAE